MQGFSTYIEYIATQGPTETTYPAFWQMVFDENVYIVVMLTQFIEQGKVFLLPISKRSHVYVFIGFFPGKMPQIFSFNGRRICDRFD